MDEQEQTQDAQPSEVEREERRLERLRLVSHVWPAAEPPARQADRWRGSEGTEKFPQLEPEGPAAA